MGSDSTIDVSVIIPVYNGANYICEAVDSVLNQTNKQIEIIVIDDGSTDGTRKILDPYIKRKEIKYHYQANAGNGAARNTGIRISKGEYICFLDHDDLLERTSIEKRLNLFKSHADIGLVLTDFTLLSENCAFPKTNPGESFMSKWDYPARIPANCTDFKEDNIYIFNNNIITELILDCFIWTGTVMIKRDVIKEIGLFNEQLNWVDGALGNRAEDHDLWIRVAMQYRIGFLNEITAFYRQHSANLTANKLADIESAINIRVKYTDPNYGLDEHSRKRISASIGKYHHRKGKLTLGTINHFDGFKDMMRAIKYDPFQLRYYFYVILTALPPKMIKILKKLKSDVYNLKS